MTLTHMDFFFPPGQAFNLSVSGSVHALYAAARITHKWTWHCNMQSFWREEKRCEITFTPLSVSASFDGSRGERRSMAGGRRGRNEAYPTGACGHLFQLFRVVGGATSSRGDAGPGSYLLGSLLHRQQAGLRQSLSLSLKLRSEEEERQSADEIKESDSRKSTWV